jgi:hypothetical protein
MKEWRQIEDIRAVRHAMTMFYPAGAGQFLEAVLSISEKVSGLAPKTVGDLTQEAATVVGRRGTGSLDLRVAKF